MKPTDIKIHQNSKRKNICLKITPDMVLHLYLPLNYHNKKIEKILEESTPWITKTIQKLAAQQESYAKILQNHNNEILAFGTWSKKEDYLTNQDIKIALLQYITSTIAYYAPLMQVTPQKIKIRNNKKVLGSCSYENNLNFSILLFFAPKLLIDYVIIHELAHIKHKNHSKAFWDFVGEFCKNYKEKRNQIKQNLRFYQMLYEKYFSLSSNTLL
ncbi:M48 family metallopeptidase [Helicobacter anatolicus]|uniref:M48 family metallopeptidase n=1 Tax=Helicobacter anatolicus TaxID=2905874 RepID=UPI001E5C9502|nr:M48 family metallopeptidase [Helicobacter anatolicus]MCE3038462.1 M48 family metallopeptidase [Helicobacter anatolicus]